MFFRISVPVQELSNQAGCFVEEEPAENTSHPSLSRAIILVVARNLVWDCSPGLPHGTFCCSLGSWILDSKDKSYPVPFLKIPNVCYLFSLIPPCGLPNISKDLRVKKNLSKHLVQLSYIWWNGGQERSNVGQQSQSKKIKERRKTQASQLSGSASCSLFSWNKAQIPQQLKRSLWSWTDFSLNLKSAYMLCDPEQFNLLV